MSSELVKKLQDSFSDVANLTPEKMRELVQAALLTFQDIQSKMQSKEPGEREEAFLIANQLKSAFESQAEKFYNSLEMGPEEIVEFIKNPANLSSPEWAAVSTMTQELAELRKNTAQQRKKTKSGKNVRLMG